MSAATIDRATVEDHLFADAQLLDEWRLQEWLETLTQDVRYVIPATDMYEATPAHSHLAIASDDMRMLIGKVERLLSTRGHCEYPFSRTRRLITNVRIVSRRENEIDVAANFIVYRARRSGWYPYVGRYEFTFLVLPDDSLKTKHRAAILDHYDLAENGGVVSILL